MNIDKKDFDYLVMMARQGADEECGSDYKYNHEKIDRIVSEYE